MSRFFRALIYKAFIDIYIVMQIIFLATCLQYFPLTLSMSLSFAIDFALFTIADDWRLAWCLYMVRKPPMNF